MTETFQTQDDRRFDFYMTHNIIMDTKELSYKAKHTYSALCRRAGNKRNCYSSHQDLADLTSMSISTVRRGLEELEEKNIIKIQKRTQTNGKQTSNLYILLDKKEFSIKPVLTEQPVSSEGVPTEQHPCSDRTTKNTSFKNIKDLNISKDILSVNTDFTKKYNELKEKSVLVDNGKYALSDFSFIGKWFLNPSESESQTLSNEKTRVASIFLQLLNKEENEFGISKAQCHGYYKILFRYMMVLERFPSDEEIKYLVSLRKKMSNATQPSKLETVFSQMKKKGLSLLDKNIEPLVIENMQLRASFGQKKQSVQPGTVKNRNETAEDFSNIRDLGGSFDEL